MRPRAGLPLSLLLWGACTDPSKDHEDSQDSGANDSGAEDDIPDPTIVGEVCYPGALLDDTACLPTVAHDTRWGEAYEYPPPLDDSPQYAAPTRFLDLDSADPDLLVAPNFALSELMQAHKGRFGLSQRGAVRHLQAIRDALGQPVRVTSGYRNITYNAGVGGATWSRHVYGDAADLQIDGRDLQDLADACTATGAAFVSVYTGHVHCDWRDDPLDEAFFPADDARRQRPSTVAVEGRLEAMEGGMWRAPVVGLDEGEPQRLWTALGPQGEVLARQERGGEVYVPPPGTARLRVEIGGRLLVLEADLP